MRLWGRLLVLVAAVCSFALTGCGYHVSGKTDLLPKDIRTIAVPAWGNATTQYKLSDYLAQSVTRELNTRTRYRVVANPKDADATLSGSVANFFSYPTVVDPATNRGTGVQAILYIQVRLVDKTGKVIFDRPNFEIRERYEIATQVLPYFDESPSAMQRLSNDVARTVVSAVLEKF